MIRQEERQRRMAHIEAACQAGARRAPACVLAGIDARTYQRWQADADRRGDGRPLAERPKPAHALSETERAEILAVANEPRFAELPPARIVPALADEGSYIASESSFYRVLRAHHQIRHRGRAHAPTAAPKPPTTHHATPSAPGLVLGHDLSAHCGPRTVVLSLPDPRPLQPQDRRFHR